jgi:hypothetical protein
MLKCHEDVGHHAARAEEAGINGSSRIHHDEGRGIYVVYVLVQTRVIGLCRARGRYLARSPGAAARRAAMRTSTWPSWPSPRTRTFAAEYRP